jgi:hypothetical protein
MKMPISSKLVLAGFASTLFSAACEKPSVGDYVESLPDLPPEIAATLDPATMATKAAYPVPAPEKASGVALAPCCSSTDQKSLQMNFPHTKCGSLRDFIVAPIRDVAALFRSNQPTAKVYKLKKLGAKTLLDTYICMTSQGPWNASLAETRACQNYAPRQMLTISAHDELVQFVWNGGVENHPANVQLVSCREVGTVRLSCGGLSSCECVSSSCPASEACQCNLQW